MKHIEIETLIKRFEGQLAAGEEREIAAHVADCCECALESAKLGEFFAYAQQHVASEVPQSVTAGILNLYKRKPRASPDRPGIRQIIAELIFDDWQMAPSERYSGFDTRQMLYRIGDFEIDVRLEMVGDLCRLTGQIFPENAGAVADISSASHSATAPLNEFGEFAFDPVPHGVYDLRITIGDEILSIDKAPLHP